MVKWWWKVGFLRVVKINWSNDHKCYVCSRCSVNTRTHVYSLYTERWTATIVGVKKDRRRQRYGVDLPTSSHWLSWEVLTSACSDLRKVLPLLPLVVAVGDAATSQMWHWSIALGPFSVTSALQWRPAAHLSWTCCCRWMDRDHMLITISYSNIFVKNKEMKTKNVDDFYHISPSQ